MEKPVRSKPGEELDKFKRRLIRAVARLLIEEKRPEKEIWKELKKETGSDCELLWTRMRALTLKKLDRLLEANDCMDAIPKPARMSLTDWLLFDLVLVHQKIDLIGQKLTKEFEDRPVLVELFELVKEYDLENLKGEKLAEGWSFATLAYNKKGHHCSPMLLQRRWYQLKEYTRFRFYDFWYAYRGNLTRMNSAAPFKPTRLQAEIGRTFKGLVTQPLLEWEELIEEGRVTLPHEFEKKMKERAGRKERLRKPSADVPDLLVLEPRIETIDLRLEPDDNATDNNTQVEEEEVSLPIVRIKQEPQDDIDIDETQIQAPKKSMYEVVLESTALENEQFDSMDAADFDLQNNDVEETEVTPRDEEESVLPQIGSVFGNVSDTSVLANVDEDRVYRNVENTEILANVDDTNVRDDNVGVDKDTIVLDEVEISARGSDEVTDDCDKVTDDCHIVDNDSARGSEREKVACDNIDENGVRNNSAVIEVSSDDKDDICDNIENVSKNVGEGSPGGVVSDEINEISDDDDMSGNVDAPIIGNDVTNVTGNVLDTSIAGDVDEPNVFSNVTCNVIEPSVGAVEPIDDVDKTNETSEVEAISTTVETSVSGNIELVGNVDEASVTTNVDDPSEQVASENVAVLNVETIYPNIVAALNRKISYPPLTNTEEVTNDVEIIDTIVEPVVITDSDEDDDHIVDDLVINKTIPKSTDEDMTVPKETKDQPMEVDSAPEVREITNEPSTLKNLVEDVISAVEKKVETNIKSEDQSYKFGELSNDISFADEGIEFVDDGIVYVDEDGNTETKIKCEKEDEDEDTPKIDEKLLLCPIIYTTRLDDMDVFNTQTDYIHVNDKKILEAIIKKSKPIKKEPETDSKETIENVTVNYCGENIESVTVNDRNKTIEYVQKIVEEDSSITVKTEPPNVESETIQNDPKDNIEPTQTIVPFECQPENDNNVTSDDYDGNENSIDESLKVKPTSYLLQKPRSRRYHPIQLCKNPDFNTRLKRLSVGFFTSPRNRVLIKSCKPLTIDLSKAFESKLVSGTLYLKPVDHNVVTEVIDDKDSHNVSVVPSALPAQSLIDNSKVADIIPLLRHCWDASKPTENIAPTSERNTVINLPDITEIRRINQRLLTAEVTPIQIQNNQFQVPVTIVTSSNNPTFPVQKSTTIAETNTDFRPIVTEATDARGPPKILEITDDPPAKKKTSEYYTGKYNDGFKARGPIIGRPPKMINGKRVVPPKPVRKPKEVRHDDIPWLSRYNNAKIHTKLDETLLTLDSLNKMLFLLTDEKEPSAPKKSKPKGKLKSNGEPTKPRGRPKLTPGDPQYMVLLKKVDEADKEKNSSSDAAPKCQPKFNVKPATNYPSQKDEDKTGTAGKEQIKKNIKYCCWARQRMLQLLFHRHNIPPHGCSKVCACCCGNLLHDYILHDQRLKVAESQIPETCNASGLDNVSVVGERTITSESFNAGTENPVQTPVESSAQVLDVETVQSAGTVPVPEDIPVIDVDATHTDTTENEPTFIAAGGTEDDVPVPAAEVSITTTEVNKLAPRGREAPVNVTARRKYVAVPIVKNQAFIPCACVRQEAGTRYVSSDNQSGGIILNLTNTPSTLITPTTTSSLSLDKVLAVKKAQAPNRFKVSKSMPPPKSVSKPFIPPKNFKEKMIFLNSKQIAEKPSQNPVFLGKNKILLTTVKFPPNLKLFEEAKKALRLSLNLPKGVRLLLLSTGTIIYKMDPNVEVDVTELAEMPSIIAAVQAHMDTQEEALRKQKDVVESEVVDLIDDDDETPPTINDNENNTPLVTEVETTNPTLTINSNDSSEISQINMSIENEEIRTDSNTNSNFQATEPDQHVVTEIQENIQGSSHNDSLSASTEQVEDQLDPTSPTLSAEKDVQHKPLSETASTVLHEVSSEKSQNKSDLTSQTLSEKDDQHEPSSPTASTAIHEVSSQNQSDPTSQTLSSEKDSQSEPPSLTGSTDHEVSAKQVQNKSGPTSPTASADINNQSKLSSQTERTDVDEVSQAQDGLEPSGQNISIEVQDHPETAVTQNTSSKIPEEGTDEPSKPKTKNILSDLMEMSGIFDEDMTSEIEETRAPQPVLTQTSLVVPLLVPEVREPPAPEVGKVPGLVMQQMLVPSKYNSSPAPKFRSPLGELSPITSLCELKYACANKGSFFKLDFGTGFLIPINVCMKSTVQPPTGQTPRNIAPKSVIDLTDDDDKPEDKSEQKDTESDTSPSKRSLLLVNNLRIDSFHGPVKPVKMFKALKPSILKRLNQNKLHVKSKNSLLKKSALDHRIKRKQFLKIINVNADSNSVPNNEQPGSSVMEKPVAKKIKLKLNSKDEPTPTTSRNESKREFASTILFDDDSSDDEPLAKKAKRKHENANAAESVTKRIEIAPAANVQEPDEKQNESELPEPDIEHVFICGDDNGLRESEVPVQNQTESESPAADTETFYMSDDDNGSIDLETPFESESDERIEGGCILGV